MTLQEMLNDPATKKMYRELAMKYHPDKGADANIMKKINRAKDSGDQAIRNLYNELLKPKVKAKANTKANTKEKESFNNVYIIWAKQLEKKLNDKYKYKLNDIIKNIYIEAKDLKNYAAVNVRVFIKNESTINFFVKFNSAKPKDFKSFENIIMKELEKKSDWIVATGNSRYKYNAEEAKKHGNPSVDMQTNLKQFNVWAGMFKAEFEDVTEDEGSSISIITKMSELNATIIIKVNSGIGTKAFLNLLVKIKEIKKYSDYSKLIWNELNNRARWQKA